jgi:hypothetical protein
MNLGINFAKQLKEILSHQETGKHRIKTLDLQKNNLLDQGIRLLMPEIRKSKSIIELNLASNEISNEGMIVIF